VFLSWRCERKSNSSGVTNIKRINIVSNRDTNLMIGSRESLGGVGDINRANAYPSILVSF
jgi:hypothetical protein